jgi:biotin operon repressor
MGTNRNKVPTAGPVMAWFRKNQGVAVTALEIAEYLGLEKIQVQVAVVRLRSRGVPIEVLSRGNVYRYQDTRTTERDPGMPPPSPEAVAAPQRVERRSVVRPIGNGFRGSLSVALGSSEGVTKGDTLCVIAALRDNAIALQSADGRLWRATPIE